MNQEGNPPKSPESANTGSGPHASSTDIQTTNLASMWQFVPFRQALASQTSRECILKIRQSPEQSRMCGFSERVDRRPVDPPPVIQLFVRERNGSKNQLLNPYYFMNATLLSDSNDEIHLLKDGRTKSTTGSSVSSLYRLKDLDGCDGAFFVFPDLSVRMEGVYKLKFTLYEIINSELHYCGSIITSSFQVYSAKKFPGLMESTPLSRAFADQGLKIRVRRDSRSKRARSPSACSSPEREAYGTSRQSSRRTSVDQTSIPEQYQTRANIINYGKPTPIGNVTGTTVPTQLPTSHRSQLPPRDNTANPRVADMVNPHLFNVNSFVADGSHLYPYGRNKLWGSAYPPPHTTYRSTGNATEPYIVYGSGQRPGPAISSQHHNPALNHPFDSRSSNDSYHYWQHSHPGPENNHQVNYSQLEQDDSRRIHRPYPYFQAVQYDPYMQVSHPTAIHRSSNPYTIYPGTANVMAAHPSYRSAEAGSINPSNVPIQHQAQPYQEEYRHFDRPFLHPHPVNPEHNPHVTASNGNNQSYYQRQDDLPHSMPQVNSEFTGHLPSFNQATNFLPNDRGRLNPRRQS